MPDHKTGTREEWLAARNELLEQENEHSRRGKELARQRRELPWVRIDEPYAFETDAGRKTLAELFGGRSQLLIYHVMFGADWAAACPGCSNLADHLSGGAAHLAHRDVTFLCMSRAPLDKLQAYKRRMGWTFPWVSSFGSDFQVDLGFAHTEEQMATGEMAQMVREAPDWLTEHAASVGAGLASSIAEGPGWNVFARSDDGVAHHTYSVHATESGLLAPYYYQLLDIAPKGRPDGVTVRRHDEYEDAASG